MVENGSNWYSSCAFRCRCRADVGCVEFRPRRPLNQEPRTCQGRRSGGRLTRIPSGGFHPGPRCSAAPGPCTPNPMPRAFTLSLSVLPTVHRSASWGGGSNGCEDLRGTRWGVGGLVAANTLRSLLPKPHPVLLVERQTVPSLAVGEKCSWSPGLAHTPRSTAQCPEGGSHAGARSRGLRVVAQAMARRVDIMRLASGGRVVVRHSHNMSMYPVSRLEKPCR